MGGMEMVIPAVIGAGAKALGSGGGGGQQAAPAAGVNPMTAGLMGQPPMPEQNPSFHDAPEGNPMLRNLKAQEETQPKTLMDSGTAFENKPWSTETVQGGPTGPAGNPMLPQPRTAAPTQPAPVKPIMAQTPEASPAPERSPQMSFDTSAPSAPSGAGLPATGGAAKPAAAASLFTDPQAWLKGVPTNPMAQMSLALLASGYDGSNPYTGIQSGLKGIPQMEMQLAAQKLANQTAEKKNQQDEMDKSAMAQVMALMTQGKQPEEGDERYSGSQRARGAARVIR